MQRRIDSPSRTASRGLMTLAFVLLVGGAAWADVPALINYQGLLADDGGSPLPSGTYCLQFGVYDGPDAGAAIVWGPETLDRVQVLDGAFNVILGATNSLDATFRLTGRYVGLQVGEDCDSLGAELLPRQPALSTPQALVASDLVGNVRDGVFGGRRPAWIYAGRVDVS